MYIDKEQTTLVSDFTELPKEVISLAKNETKSFKKLKAQTHFKWTYITPALNLDLNGLEQNNYDFFGTLLHFNDKGENALSYLDSASAIIKKRLLDDGHLHQITAVANVSLLKKANHYDSLSQLIVISL